MAEKIPTDNGEKENKPNKMERIAANLMQVELNSIEFVDEKTRAIKALSRLKLLAASDGGSDDADDQSDDNTQSDEKTKTAKKSGKDNKKK